MAYTLPSFNITVNLWRFGVSTATPPASSPIANFNVGRRISGGDYWTTTIPKSWYVTSWLLLPKGTVIIGDITGVDQGDTVEIPAGSGLYYHVFWADRSALGFGNEHIAAIVVQLPGPPAPPPGGAFLMEDGVSYFLMEDGVSRFLLE